MIAARIVIRDCGGDGDGDGEPQEPQKRKLRKYIDNSIVIEQRRIANRVSRSRRKRREGIGLRSIVQEIIDAQ
jgi:hypothetical protein